MLTIRIETAKKKKQHQEEVAARFSPPAETLITGPLLGKVQMSVWNEETEDQLVRLVQERSALYDITEKLYTNKAKKTELWQEIEKKLGIAEKELKKRWDSLRTQYTRYRKRAGPAQHPAITTGRQQWILASLRFLEPHRKRKEVTSEPNLRETPAVGSDSTSDNISYIKTEVPSSPLCNDTQCSTPTDEESSNSEAEYPPTPLREEPWPSTSTESRPLAKRSKKQLEEPSSEESTNLLRTISKTVETLASRQEHDDISAYCKNLERKMRKLPPHILPHLQHEVDTLLYRYLIITTSNHSGQTPESHCSQQ